MDIKEAKEIVDNCRKRAEDIKEAIKVLSENETIEEPVEDEN